MELWNQVWTWLGYEIANFGLRWGVVVLGFSGFFGWRYREMKRQVAELKEKLDKKQPQVTDVQVLDKDGNIIELAYWEMDDGARSVKAYINPKTGSPEHVTGYPSPPPDRKGGE